MSPAMKKPERVEVGQWWVTRFGGQAPDRVTPDAIAALCAFQSEMSHWIDARDYLGSGDHPEPSEWMIETLAEHLWNSTRSATGLQWGETYNGHSIDEHTKENEREDVRRILGGSRGRSRIRRFLVLDAYRILRSLGKW
jgi:hypothetical protein